MGLSVVVVDTEYANTLNVPGAKVFVGRQVVIRSCSDADLAGVGGSAVRGLEPAAGDWTVGGRGDDEKIIGRSELLGGDYGVVDKRWVGWPRCAAVNADCARAVIRLLSELVGCCLSGVGEATVVVCALEANRHNPACNEVSSHFDIWRNKVDLVTYVSSGASRLKQYAALDDARCSVLLPKEVILIIRCGKGGPG